ncbi:MAG: hypothetical protein IKC01_05530, partial [Clostridia bacterium]|nr:hypothetical protein [Clostridia bacterium]
NDKIDLLAITSFNGNNLQSIETITEKFNITQTMTTKFVKSIAYKFETNAFDNAEISSNFNYSFQKEINIQIIDTYGKNCAIINFNNKTIAISFSDYNDLHLIAKEAGGIDVLIISEKVPADYSVPVDTLIVCSAYDNNIDKNDKTGRIYSENFFRTSSGDITLNI